MVSVRSSRPSGPGSGRARISRTSMLVFILSLALVAWLSLLFILPSSSNADRLQQRFNPVLRQLGFSADTLFDNLVVNHPFPTDKTVVIEVGCYRLRQSAFAAKVGFKTLSYDASPDNIREMQKELRELPSAEAERIAVFHMAVTSKSGSTLTFSSIGGTGDHVSGVSIDQGNARYMAKPDHGEVQVNTIALDDVVRKMPEDEYVYLLKVDVQGHEASVFDGLRETLPTGRVRHILFEYWVDALDEARGHPFGTCSSVVDILVPLVRAGYELFDLSITAHPKAGTRVTHAHLHKYFRPLDFEKHCKWFASKGKEDRDTKSNERIEPYKMGYWTDILAVYKGDFSSAETEALNWGKRGRMPITTGFSWVKDDWPKRPAYWAKLFQNRETNSNREIK